MYRRKTIQITIAFSSEAAEVMKRRCKWLRVKQHQPTVLLPLKIPFKNQEGGKPLKDEEKLTRFVTNRSKPMTSYRKFCGEEECWGMLEHQKGGQNRLHTKVK